MKKSLILLGQACIQNVKLEQLAAVLQFQHTSFQHALFHLCSVLCFYQSFRPLKNSAHHFHYLCSVCWHLVAYCSCLCIVRVHSQHVCELFTHYDLQLVALLCFMHAQWQDVLVVFLCLFLFCLVCLGEQIVVLLFFCLLPIAFILRFVYSGADVCLGQARVFALYNVCTSCCRCAYSHPHMYSAQAGCAAWMLEWCCNVCKDYWFAHFILDSIGYTNCCCSDWAALYNIHISLMIHFANKVFGMPLCL